MALSEDIVRFVKEHIHSVLQLEVLLLLRSGGEWTADTVAEELRITQQSAEFRLRDLELRGLVRAGATPDSFRYEAPTAEVARVVEGLADAYSEMRYSVINLIFSVPGDSARTLAEAFRIRKRKDD